ncbi:FAD-binding protein, partial [Paraburkholderia sp. BR14262]|uniref:FAD-binding protein n=1 Tax=Paraburkholderia sp. BR14262 TaxID=3236999 RepID=UPI0034CF53D4
MCDPARRAAPTLPPGIDEARFARALAAFEGIVGAPNVCRGGAALDPYFDPFVPLADAHAFAPSAAILPASVEEIRAILRVANDTRVPLWTVSAGRNFAYGGAAPRLAGSVDLDLQRQNRILDVDERRAWAPVEPGVSYCEWLAHL